MLTVTEALIRSFCSFSIGFVFVTLISSLTTVRQSEKNILRFSNLERLEDFREFWQLSQSSFLRREKSLRKIDGFEGLDRRYTNQE